MLMHMMVGDSGQTAVLLGVDTVGRELMVRDLTEVEPGFPGIRAS